MLFVRPRIARCNSDSVHRLPHSTSVTIAKRPSIERGMRGGDTDFGKNEREVFLWEGWTGGIGLKVLEKLVFWRT
jgi:hypothetical protein